MFVLFNWFNTHPLSRQKSLIARGIARRWHELEISMTTAKEEPSPEVRKTALYTGTTNVPYELLYMTHNKENID